MKHIRIFYLFFFSFLVVIVLVYLNRHVFAMLRTRYCRQLNHNVRNCTFGHIRPTKTPVSLHIRVDWQSSLSKKRTIASLAIKMCPVKIVIRMREYADWSESSLGAYVRKYVFCRCGLNTGCDTESHLCIVDMFLFLLCHINKVHIESFAHIIIAMVSE